jgi:Tfp pilus assembly protein PilF
VGAAYANSFRGVFLFDDLTSIVGNPSVRTLWPPAALTWNSLRPLAFFSFAVSHAVAGYEVWAFHAMSLACHVAAALALYGFARRALRLPRVGLSDDDSTAAAFATALLWGVHPLNTQAVDYIVQRAEVMAGLGCLLALYCLVRSVGTEDAPARRKWQAATALAFYGALGSKEAAVAAPLVLYPFDALVVEGSFAAPLRRRRGLYVALAAPFVIVPLVWIVAAPWRFGALAPNAEAPLALDYARSQPAVVVGYLRRVVWPSGLNFDHGWDPADHDAEIPWAAAAVAAALVAIIAAALRRAPAAWLGAAFFLALAPTSSVLPLTDRMVEHRMYLASAACVASAVLGGRRAIAALVRAPRARRAAGAAAVLAAAAALGVATYVRNEDYTSGERMWTDVVAKAPRNARGHYNLGCAILGERGVPAEDRALAEFLEAARLRPGYAPAHNNAGAIWFHRGRYEEAARHFGAAISSPDVPLDSVRNYGRALMELHRWDEAAEVFRRAAEFDPDRARAQADLAAALAASGRVAETIDAWLAALAAASPSAPAASTGRATLVDFCVRTENRAAAREHLEDVVRRDPANAEAVRVLEFVRSAR